MCVMETSRTLSKLKLCIVGYDHSGIFIKVKKKLQIFHHYHMIISDYSDDFETADIHNITPIRMMHVIRPHNVNNP